MMVDLWVQQKCEEEKLSRSDLDAIFRRRVTQILSGTWQGETMSEARVLLNID
jgi:hypothetical protein